VPSLKSQQIWSHRQGHEKGAMPNDVTVTHVEDGMYLVSRSPH
jgi:hypothetical protein